MPDILIYFYICIYNKYKIFIFLNFYAKYIKKLLFENLQ